MGKSRKVTDKKYFYDYSNYDDIFRINQYFRTVEKYVINKKPNNIYFLIKPHPALNIDFLKPFF